MKEDKKGDAGVRGKRDGCEEEEGRKKKKRRGRLRKY